MSNTTNQETTTTNTLNNVIKAAGNFLENSSRNSENNGTSNLQTITTTVITTIEDFLGYSTNSQIVDTSSITTSPIEVSPSTLADFVSTKANDILETTVSSTINQTEEFIISTNNTFPESNTSTLSTFLNTANSTIAEVINNQTTETSNFMKNSTEYGFETTINLEVGSANRQQETLYIAIGIFIVSIILLIGVTIIGCKRCKRARKSNEYSFNQADGSNPKNGTCLSDLT